MPVTLHAMQAPAHAVAQHTPSAQWADVQSASATQPAPSDFFGRAPQLPFVQTAGNAQSASVVQVALQTPVPHSNGKHELAAGVTHPPWPSQVEPGVYVVAPAGQVESAQAVPSAYC